MTPNALPNRRPAPAPADVHPLARRLGRLAVASLHTELVCAPKPGLVTPFDSGSHTDMTAATFLRSLFALRGYFVAIAEAGRRGAGFAGLNRLGRTAEAQMLHATDGVNTHRGAIFGLGLLTAAAAALQDGGLPRPRGEAVCGEVARRWGDALGVAPLDPASHGQQAVRRYGARGARAEAVDGFPALREVALPVLRAALADGLTREAALVHTLMHLIADLMDTNLLHRSGPAGLAFAQTRARDFLAAGGAYARDWRPRLEALGRAFVARRLSPGGSADLLACAWFLVRVESL